MNFQKKLIALLTIVRKETVRFFRIWAQTILPPVINQTLYFIIFGAYIGSLIGQIHGISYMAFIVPGLVMMAVINSSFMNVVSSFFSAKFQRNIEELLVSPTPNWVIVTGYAAAGVLRATVVGTIIFLITIAFTTPKIHNIGMILLFIILTSTVFALGGLINGIFANKFDDINIFPSFVLTPLTYFGGVFYSIKDLPPLWQTISKFNPILYMVDGFRYGFYGIADINVNFSIVMLITFTFVLAWTSLYLLRRGVGLKQ